MRTTRTEVTRYWSARKNESNLGTDWADALTRCWRCGHERSLQRCHITPASLGGPDEPSNLVLLCALCHREAPNHTSPHYMWLWIKGTAVPLHDTYWNYRVIEEFERIFGRKPFENILENASLRESARGLMKAEFQKVIVHYGEGRLNAATSACVIAEFERKLADGGLEEDYPAMSTTTIDELTRQARNLSEIDRARLAESLLESLQTSDTAVQADWHKEIEARVAAFDRGEMPSYPAEDVFAEARRLAR